MELSIAVIQQITSFREMPSLLGYLHHLFDLLNVKRYILTPIVVS